MPKIMREALTDESIQALKPKDKAYKIADGGGLNLHVLPSGSKSWRIKFAFGGKEQTLVLGQYPQISLQDARTSLAEAKKQLAHGINPCAAKKEAQEAQARDAYTFRQCAEAWLSCTLKGKSESTKRHTQAYANTLLGCQFASLPLHQVTRSNIADCILSKAADSPAQARKLAATANAIMRYAIALGRIETNPASELNTLIPQHTTTHHAAIIEPQAFGRLLRSIDELDALPIAKIALQLLPLVMVRSGELCGARWSEIDLDHAVWIIPPERMKSRKAHRVPLSQQAVALFKSLQAYSAKDSEYCFPAQRTGKRGHMAEATLMATLRKCQGFNGKQTIHGFRISCATILANSLGCNTNLIESALAHNIGGKVTITYIQTDYFEERQAMMQTWANYCDKIKAES